MQTDVQPLVADGLNPPLTSPQEQDLDGVPNQLIIQTRIALAARLLTETKRSVGDIAYECGFYDHSAMTRAFRSATNLTPTQFRSLKKV